MCQGIPRMRSEFLEIINRRLQIPLDEGPDKVCSLEEAIRRHVRSGMTLYCSTAHARPGALLRELIRQYWGTRPEFTVASVGIGSPWTALIYGGLARKVITTFLGEGYPMPAPNRLIQQAYRDGAVEIQNWSMLTFPLRLLAGAMGVPFLPTKSLLGSSMEEENRGDFFAMEDPFGHEGRVGCVRALVPDLALIHAWAADRAGNVLVPLPQNENVYGALAARKGALVSVEKIVPTDFIRRHADLVKLPGSYVQAVVEAPMGAHPGGMYGMGVPELEGYAEDLPFILETREAFRSPEGADPWIGEWILECNTHEAYLRKVGHERICYLKGRADADAWVSELEMLSGSLSPDPVYNGLEMAIIAASRTLAERVRAEGYNTFLAGIGASNLAAWLAAYQLKSEGVDVDLMAEAGLVGYLPRPADPYVFSFRNFPSCKLLTDILHVMGIFMGGRHNRCIGSLAAGQVDKHGNINSTVIPGHTYLTGSGGANDVCSSASEVLVTLTQSRHRFVEKVPYITGPGGRVRTVVSDLGVYEKSDEHGELVLSGLLPDYGGAGKEERVQRAKAACGWELRVASHLQEMDPPTAEELRLLRLFDPRRYFLGESL